MPTKPDKRHISKFLLLMLLFLCFAAAGAAFIYYTWSISIEGTEREAIQLATAAEAGIQKSSVSKLTGNADDIISKEYAEIKNTLIKLVELNNNARFAYIYIQRDGKIYILADSEPIGSGGYSPPGQEYTEATQDAFSPYLTGKTIMSGPVTDRWGTWMSVLVPMRDFESGNVISVFGVDYSVESWNDRAVIRTIQAVVVVLCVFLILVAFVHITNRNKALIRMDVQLKEREELFRTIFNEVPIGLALGHNDEYIIANDDDRPSVNPMLKRILGRTTAEVAGIRWMDITHPDDLSVDLDHYDQFKSGQISGYHLEKRYSKPDGSYIWANVIIASLHLSNNKYNHMCLVEDISDRKKIESALFESERSKAVLLSHLPGLAYRCIYDANWTMQYVSAGCYKLTGYQPESLIDNKELSFNELIAPDYRDILWREWERVIALRNPFRYEYEIITRTGEYKWVLEMGQGSYDANGDVEALEGIIIDISEQKMQEAQILYMENHDYLTGLYNRKYYEEAMEQLNGDVHLPIAVMSVDINGLRLVNESLGYPEGDMLLKTTSKILESCCRPGDVLARVSGGGFGLLLPNTDHEAALGIQKLIESTCAIYNQNTKTKLFDINLSVGYSIKDTADDDIRQADKLANEFLRERKLLNRKSSHSDIITSMMSIVNEKSRLTEEHAVRLASLCKKIGEKLNLPPQSLDELELLAMLHDIGKVGIDDRILNKPGYLDEEEWAIMKRHPEIGHRIAKSSSVLEPIAEYILSHHERWDGKGYPRRLEGEDIPLLSRILAVADAYDAMTEDRVYRKAMPKEVAVAEIRNNAGIQFDPHVVRIFCENLSIENE